VDEDRVSRIERRRALVRQRVRELQERIDALARRRSDLDIHIAEALGSGTEQLRVAREDLERARQRARIAAELAADARRISARTHERVAWLQEQIANTGRGDFAEHARRAVEHDRAAEADLGAIKDAAAEVAGHVSDDPS